MRRPAAAALTAVALGAAMQAAAQAPAGIERGRRVYENNCAVCHDPGPGHPGTQLLAIKRGPEFAVIRGRRDLAADYVQSVVRNGHIEMPPFRPTDASDADIAALVEFLHSAAATDPAK